MKPLIVIMLVIILAIGPGLWIKYYVEKKYPVEEVDKSLSLGKQIKLHGKQIEQLGKRIDAYGEAAKYVWGFIFLLAAVRTALIFIPDKPSK